MTSVELNLHHNTTEETSDTKPLIHDTNQGETKSKWSRKQSIATFITLIVIVIIIVIVVIIETSKDSSSIIEADILYIYHEQSRIYSMDHINQNIMNNTAVEAICIDVKNKRFISMGNGMDVLSDCNKENYELMKKIYINGTLANNISIIPGLIDSHAHIMSYGSNFFRVDLSTASTISQVRDLIADFIINNQYDINIQNNWVTGWGWDQGLFNWTNESYDLIQGLPTRQMLDDSRINDYKLFLRRIDGHSAWINDASIAAINWPSQNFTIIGGEIIYDENGLMTGALVDNAMDYISTEIPPFTENQQFEMLEIVLNECAENGLTGIHDAGNGPNNIELFKTVIDNPNKYGFKMSLRINAMASYNWIPNDYSHLKTGENGEMYKDLLTVNTVKFMMDGALGSRGAALIEPYCDLNTSSGLLFYNISNNQFYDNISFWLESGYQIATHAIGDNANRIVIDNYIQLINDKNLTNNHRLRIEHAQIVNALIDIPLIGLNNILPSMQPTHCTSDMIFAGDRLNCTQFGDRLTGAYAWQAMLNNSVDALPFGSDFPAVGVVNPFLGIYAAITRKDQQGNSPVGQGQSWTPYNRVSRYQAIKGYTYDAAYAAFQEDRLGTISRNKFADFIIIDRDIFECDEMDILDTSVIGTYMGGQPMYINQTWKNIIDF